MFQCIKNTPMIETFDDLILFLHRFHKPWGDHLPSANIPEDLPPPLRRMYAEFGSLIDIDGTSARRPFGTQDALVSTQFLKRVDDMYEFASENQGNWSCRTPIGPDDPPVYSNSRDAWEAGPAKGFQLVCNSLEHFLTTLCLQEAVMSCPNLVALDGVDVTQAFAVELHPLWLNGVYVNGDPTHHFYRCPGTGLVAMIYGDGWIGSHADDTANKLRPGTRFQRISTAV